MNKPIIKPEWIPSAYLDADKNTPLGDNNSSTAELRGPKKSVNVSKKKKAVRRKKQNQ